MAETVLAASLLGLQDDVRLATLKSTHPLYARHVAEWALLGDAYEGDGGFLTGEYLWRFPAELPADYNERKQQARYHNFQETLVDIYVRHVFGQGVNRTTNNEDLKAWWDDVDGAGTTMSAFMARLAAHALNQGHCGALVDKTPDEATGPTKADERATVVARIYMATEMLDWRLNQQAVTGVKLGEATPETDITAPPSDAVQYLFWTDSEWARFDAAGDLVADAEHGLGLVPLAVLRPKPSKRHALLGRSLTSAGIVRALFNRASEEDHVLRNQGFSLLGVQVPSDTSAETLEITQKNVEANYGVKRAIVTVGSLAYASPDMAIPAAIRENMQFLIRELYRAAHIAYSRDSLDAESAEALRIKHVELNEMLRALAVSLADVEKRMARFWFGWTSATPEAAQAAYEAADVSAQYPSEFFTKELEADLQAWGEAVRFGLPDLFVKRMQKRIVRRIEPEIPAEIAQEIDDLIDAMPAKSQAPTGGAFGTGTPEELRARAAERLKRFTAANEPSEDEAAA